MLHPKNRRKTVDPLLQYNTCKPTYTLTFTSWGLKTPSTWNLCLNNLVTWRLQGKNVFKKGLRWRRNQSRIKRRAKSMPLSSITTEHCAHVTSPGKDQNPEREARKTVEPKPCQPGTSASCPAPSRTPSALPSLLGPLQATSPLTCVSHRQPSVHHCLQIFTPVSTFYVCCWKLDEDA